MRLPSTGTGSVSAGTRHVADVHYTIKRTPDGIKADIIVIHGQQFMDHYDEVTLHTKEGQAITCIPESGTQSGVCTFHINDLG